MDEQLDPDAGTVSFTRPDGSEVHFFLPQGGAEIYADDVDKFFAELLKQSTGTASSPETERQREDLSWGYRTRTRTRRITPVYSISILQEEKDVGASGVSSQIALWLASGIAAGVTASIGERILDFLLPHAAGSETKPLSDDQLVERVTRLLRKRFHAVGDVRVERMTTKDDVVRCVAVDARGTVFDLRIRRTGGVEAIEVYRGGEAA